MTSSLTPAHVIEPGDLTFYASRMGNVPVPQTRSGKSKLIQSGNVESVGNHKSPNAYWFRITEQTPFRGRTVRHVQAQYRDTWQESYVGDIYFPEVLPLDNISAFTDSQVYNKCLAKVISQMKNSDVNLGTTVGEGRETLSLIRNIGGSALEVMVNIRQSLRKRDWRKFVRTLGGTTLMYSLGIAPLLADVEALRKHVLSGKAEEVLNEFSGRASDTVDKVHHRPDLSSYLGSVPPNFDVIEQTTVSTRCQLAGYYVVKDLHSYENWRAGIGLRPSLAWELITLSWLVDYFLKIGSFLEQMEAALLYNGFELRDAYITTSHRVTSRQEMVGRVTTMVDGDYLAITEAVRTYSYKDKARSLISSLPPPTLPTFTIPRSSTQLLNCASLLSQLLK